MTRPQRPTLSDRAYWTVLDGYLRAITKSSRPILVGPYRSEVGFEVLYWLPFLAWAQKTYALDPSRFVVVTRGGAGTWYPQGSRLLELYDLMSLEQCRIATRKEHAETGVLKQTRVTAFDRNIYRKVCEALGDVKPFWLHPSWMYTCLAPWWEGRAGLDYLLARTTFPVLPTVPVPETWQLPEKFIAVRFYARPTLPMSAVTLDFVRQWTESLAQRVPLVVLNPRVHVDDHIDFKVVGDNIAIMPAVEPAENLALTAAVLKRSQGFIGTYGGFAQLALRLGVPSLSVYDQWQMTLPAHKALSDHLSLMSGVGFQVMSMKNVGYWRSLLP